MLTISRAETVQSGLVPVVLLVTLVALLLTALIARSRLRRAAAVLLLPAGVAWVLFNGPLEGAVLLTLTSSHGVTTSDLLAVVAVVVAVAVLTGRLRRGP